MDHLEYRSRLGEDDKRALAQFEQRCGKFGSRELRVMPLGDVEVRDSGNPEVEFTVQGHAAVFGRKSLDLGYFTEVIDRGAFDKVLDTAPDVHLLWDHDTRLALARTKSSQYTLELRDDPKGLRFYSKVAPTSFAADLRILMDGGIIDQASFAFTVASDTWEIHDDGKGNETVVRTVHEVGELYDVTICAQGAFPQTDSSVVRSYVRAIAVDAGAVEVREAVEDADTAPETPDVPDDAISDDAAPDALSEGDSADVDAAQDEPVDDTEVRSATDDDAPVEGAEDDSAAPVEGESHAAMLRRKLSARMAAVVAHHNSEVQEVS